MIALLMAQGVLRAGPKPLWYTASVILITLVVLVWIGRDVTRDERPVRREPLRMRVPKR